MMRRKQDAIPYRFTMFRIDLCRILNLSNKFAFNCIHMKQTWNVRRGGSALRRDGNTSTSFRF